MKSWVIRLGDRLTKTLRSFGQIRDGFLVMAAVFYLLGYLVWSINAYRVKLGLLSALDFQYFIAGIIPVIIIASLLALIVGVIRLRRKVKTTLVAGVTGWKLLLRRTLFILWWLSLVIVMLSVVSRFQRLFSKTGLGILAVVVLLTFSSTSLLLPPLDESAPSASAATGWLATFKPLWDSIKGLMRIQMLVQSFLGTLYAWLLILSFPALAFAFFLFGVYPKVPQEFGGTRPRCAYLDISKAQVSNQTLNDIVPAEGLKSTDPVLRSAKVEILFGKRRCDDTSSGKNLPGQQECNANREQLRLN